MVVFTVIGLWPDTDQRFATHVSAQNAKEAEAKCAKQYAGVTICGIIRGRHACVDSKSQLVHATLYDR